MEKIKVKYLKLGKKYTEEQRAGFIDVYKKAFAGPPYFETYQDGEVMALAFEPHISKGCIYLAVINGQAIGLACCLSIAKIDEADPNISALESLRSFLSLPFSLDNTCYMSELAVLPEFRESGIGTKLIVKRLKWARKEKLRHYVMRTASEGSNSQGLYLKLGAKIIPDLSQDVSNCGVNSASKKRIFLFGNI